MSDALFGAPSAESNGVTDSGRGFIIFGKSGNTETHIATSSLNGADGVSLNGINSADFVGHAGPGGDVNGDGLTDILIGSEFADAFGRENSGEVYLVFGQSQFAQSVQLSALDGSNGVRIAGEDTDHRLGRASDMSGDFNGDGFDDIVIGDRRASFDDVDRAGSVYVVFGSEATQPAQFDLSVLDGVNGFRIDGESAVTFAGFNLASAGDVNGDGFDDIIIGA